jgi:acetyl esterase/lipase
MIYLHGGGWAFGSPTSFRKLGMQFAEAGYLTIVLDYRLAPEHPFPASLEDCWDALQWVAAHADGPLILGGDSAGGNMTAVCTLRARDRGGPELALQVLVYPAVGNDLTTESARLYGSGPDTFLTIEEMEYFWGHYAGNEADDTIAELVPLNAGDHSGLPPAIVVTGHALPLRRRVPRVLLAREPDRARQRGRRAGGRRHPVGGGAGEGPSLTGAYSSARSASNSSTNRLRASHSRGVCRCAISLPSTWTGVPCVPTVSSPSARATIV